MTIVCEIGILEIQNSLRGNTTVAKSGNQSSNIVAKAFGFMKSSVEELRKVHFPTRQETIRSSIGVLFLIIVFASFLGLTDWAVGSVMRYVLNLNG